MWTLVDFFVLKSLNENDEHFQLIDENKINQKQINYYYNYNRAARIVLNPAAFSAAP